VAMAGANTGLVRNSLRMAFRNFPIIFIFISLNLWRISVFAEFARIAPHARITTHARIAGRLARHAVLASQTLGRDADLAGIAILAERALAGVTRVLASVAEFARLALAGVAGALA
jgi:hypothetical protein